MIYNLIQYLKTNFPAEIIYANYELANSPDRIILIKETGGPIVPRVKFASPVIQVMCRDIDTVKARMISYDIYDLINDVYGLVLPAVTIDGETYASIQLAQISANQQPYPFGVDEQGRYVFINNYRIHFTEA